MIFTPPLCLRTLDGFGIIQSFRFRFIVDLGFWDAVFLLYNTTEHDSLLLYILLNMTVYYCIILLNINSFLLYNTA
jgi:hypothetical protein